MLATIQEYAVDQLPEVAAGGLKRAHARYFLGVLCAASQQLEGADYISALERITIDFANFETGIRESQASEDHNAVFGYSASLADYLRIRGRHADRLTLALAARAAAGNINISSIAAADNNLGNAYGDLPKGDRGDNLQRAIACYEAAARGYDTVGMANEEDRARTAARELEEQLKKVKPAEA